MKRCVFLLPLVVVIMVAILLLPNATNFLGNESKVMAASTQDVIAGDVDGSKKVNSADVTILRRYVSGGWNVSIDEIASDVNANNAVNAADILLLRRYISGGWDVVLQTPSVPEALELVFSKDGGIYGSEFSLTIEAPTGYTIYYTTDGSDPMNGGGYLYTGAIAIRNSSKGTGTLTKSIGSSLGHGVPSSQLVGTVIKAYAVKGTETIPTVTNSYIVSSNYTNTYKLPTVSISLKASDFGTSSGIYVSVMNNPFGTKERKIAFVEMFDESGSKVAGQYIELSMQGNGSLGNAQKSMRMYFKKDANPAVLGNPGKLKYDIFGGEVADNYGAPIDSYKRLILRNSGNDNNYSYLRDAFMHKVSVGLNCDLQASQPAMVYINGEFWGLYNVRERYDGKYFESHYGIDELNYVLLEAPSPLVTGNGNSPYVLNDGVAGDEIPFYDLLDFANKNSLSVQSNYDQVAAQLDIDSLIDVAVANLFFCNTDWPTNNVKVWRNKNAADPSGFDTKWHFVMVDMDSGCGLATDYTKNMMECLEDDAVLSRLFKSLLNNDGFKQQFIKRFETVVNEIYAPEKTKAVLAAMASEIESAMSLNIIRWPSSGNSMSKWNSEVDEIETFISRRGEYALEDLYEYFGIAPVAFNVVYADGVTSVNLNKNPVSAGEIVTVDGGGYVTVNVTVDSGYDYNGIVVIDTNGTKTKYTSNNITFKATKKATISILTSKKSYTTNATLVAGSRCLFYLDKSGNLYAWGNSENGQCGVYTGDKVLPITHIMSNVKQVAVSQGGNVGDNPHTLILTGDNKLFAVGSNAYCQTGYNGASNTMLRPVAGVPSGTIKEISAGFDHTLILMENGDMYGIGNNAKGQLGSTNLGGSVTSFIKLASNVSSIAAGRRHSVYVVNGTMYGMGDNRWNKLAKNGMETCSTPVKMADNVKKVFAGEHSSFYINNNNDLYYIGWRSPYTFLTGEGDGLAHKVLSNVASVSMQDEHALINTLDGKVYGWGLNSYKQTSPNSATSYSSTPVLLGENTVSSVAGSWFSAILYSNGDVEVFGKNTSGITGRGFTSDSVSRTTISASSFN